MSAVACLGDQGNAVIAREHLAEAVSGYVRVIKRAGFTASGRRARAGRGRILFDSGKCNLIVTTAKSYLGDLVRGATGSYAFGAMAVGSDTTAPVIGNTQLGSETTRLGIPADGTNTATQKNLRSGTTITIRQTFTGITGTIGEFGLFGNIASPPGAANAGTLFNRALIGPVTLAGTDTLTVESQLTFN